MIIHTVKNLYTFRYYLETLAKNVILIQIITQNYQVAIINEKPKKLYRKTLMPLKNYVISIAW